MDGFILTVSSNDHHKVWRTVFLKLDDISAKLVAFSDRSQFEVLWSVQLVDADIASPVPGEPNYGIHIDDTPFCFYIRHTTAKTDETHFFSAGNDQIKKKWMTKMLQIAKDGPQSPRFAITAAENEFVFNARVVKFQTHDDGTHAEYMITCSCQLFSKLAARRLAKEWTVWHRFSEFDALNKALKLSLGPQMKEIPFIKQKRDAFRSILGKALEQEFLEQRRLQLDTYVTRICENRTAVDFFKHHSDPNLKNFFMFDDNCHDVDTTPRKAKPSRSKQVKSPTNTEQSIASDDSRPSSSTRDSDVEVCRSHKSKNDNQPSKNTTNHNHHHHRDKSNSDEGKVRRSKKEKTKRSTNTGSGASRS